jgi:hypothetical protein
MFKFKLVALAVALVTLVAGSASANPITFLGTGYASDVTIRHNGSNLSVRAGEILVDFDGTDLTTYCVDLNHWIKNTWDATIVPVTTVNGGLAVAYLYDNFATAVASSIEGAGLQIAIWKIIDDFGGTLSLTDGNFLFTGPPAIVSSAQTYLNALPIDLGGYTTPSYILASGPSPRSQDLIAPEPATLVLFASSLPIILLNRRR